MNKQAVLDVLNSLEVAEINGGEDAYILVANNEENRMKLNAVGVSDETIRKYGGDDEFVCILALAFHGGYADDYKDGKFVLKHELTEQQIIVTLATKVMGWTLSRNELYWHIDGEIQAVSGWNPLQNIADAWQVVEQIEKDGFDVQIYRGQGFTSVEIIEPSQGMIIGEYEGGTTQESICHAALRVFAADLSHR